jgi:hypothetical protein
MIDFKCMYGVCKSGLDLTSRSSFQGHLSESGRSLGEPDRLFGPGFKLKNGCFEVRVHHMIAVSLDEAKRETVQSASLFGFCFLTSS